MILSDYLALTRGLIQTPQSPIPLIDDGLLTIYINTARNQVALDGECIRTFGTAAISAGVVSVPIVDLATFSASGQPMVVRNAWLNAARIDIRSWDWFVSYNLEGAPATNPVMAHHGAGSLTYLYISSSGGGELMADIVALPLSLVDDTTFDHVPYPWSDAVPFYAAYYAYMAMQRQADAEMFMGRYRELMRRARTEVTSTALPENDPGGIGAQLAASKVPLGLPPAAPGRR